MEQLERGADFRVARDEVGWFFASSGAAMGLHGQSIGETSGGGVWDAARSHRAHMTRWSPGHRAAVARCERVGATFALLDRSHRKDLELVYMPFGWGRLDGATVKDKDRANWDVYCRFAVKTMQLLALALVTPEMEAAFVRVHPDTEPSFGGLLGFVLAEVIKLKNENIRPGKAFPTGHRLAPALHAAERRELAAITAYDERRIVRARSDRRPNVALLEKHRAEQEKREWDRFEARTGVRLEGVA